MTDVGIDDTDDRSAWRTQWRLLKEKLDQPIASEEALLNLLLAPIVLIGLDKHLEKDSEISSLLQIHGDWKFLDIGSPLSQEAIRNFRWIGDFQLKLLQNILPDWYEVVQKYDLLSFVLKSWFAPFTSKQTNEENSGAVAICSMVTLNTLLSERVPDPEGRIKQRPETWELLQNVLQLFVENLSLSSIMHSCQILIAPNQKELQWSNSIRHLFSLPDRIANAYQGQFPLSLSLHKIRAKIGEEFEELIFDGLNSEMISVFLSKLLRSGWFQDTQRWENDSISIWPAIIRSISKRINKDGQFEDSYRSKWRKLISILDDSDRNELMTSLSEAIDRLLRNGGKSQLINGSEAFRPGAEGLEFLSASTWENALRIAATFELFLAEEEGNEDNVAISSLSCLLPTSSNAKNSKVWSPLMIRILLHIIDKYDEKHSYRDILLVHSIKAWSQQTKVASWPEEEYLATLLVLLICTASSESSALKSLSTMPDFIQGVSQHLSHLSPVRRRMGMLLAEMVSERSGKALKFGKSAWDGKGEGREEARVLRTLAFGFSAREKDVKLDRFNLLSAFQLNEKIQSMEQIDVQSRTNQKGNNPISRTLPVRKPAPNRSPMIQMVGEDEKDSNSRIESIGSSLNKQRGGRNLISNLSDEEQSSSSSEEESSSDEEDGNADLATGQEEGKAFGLGTPNNKKKPRLPIYISQLAPLLRSNERDGVRIGIKYAEDLVRRKAGWGGEVNENAIDLCLALLALNNNFRIAQFDQRRLGALTALVRASPDLIAPCLAEHYFDHQYSMVQRIAMLNALAFGAAELATGKKVSEVPKSGKIGNNKSIVSVNKLAEQFSQLAMRRAREEGKERLPEIRNEESLKINKSTKMINDQQEIERNPIHSGSYLSFANSYFIFPLINRLWNHIQSASILHNRKSSNYMGAGRTIIDMPFLMGALLDTLAVLCHYAQNEVRFRQDVIPEIIQMILTLTRIHLNQLSNNSSLIVYDEEDDDENRDGGSHSTILGASASLILVLLDSAWQLDFGKSIVRQNANLLNEVQLWANAVFEVGEKGSEGGGSNGGLSGMSRSSRSSAAILIRINEIYEHQKVDFS